MAKAQKAKKKISLPICRWRESSLPETHVCHSTKFVLGPNRVSEVFCANCFYVDHNPSPALPPPLPCVHLEGGLGEEMKSRSSLSGNLQIFGCSLHGKCVVRETDSVLSTKIRSCTGCSDYLSRDPFGPNSSEMKQQADAFLSAVPRYPGRRYRGRGVVIAGGGDRYFPSLYITIRALRHVDCKLPIQVWYLGRNDEMPARLKKLLAPFNVDCVDADKVRLRHPARNLNGWELKVFATLHSSFEEVLFLDADCYPCRNPEFLFDLEDYQNRGAIFWPDMATFDTRLKWPAFGMTDPRRAGSVESGQYVINKKKCWPPLNLAWFYNDHSDFFYRYCYGDKHTFEVAWIRCQQPFVMWQPNAVWAKVAYLHPGPDQLPLFIHRCADKFRFEPQEYVTNQNHQALQFQRDLPLERECWGWLGDLAQGLGQKLVFPLIPEKKND